MIIKTSGAVSFWLDKSKNPMAFKEGASIFWVVCRINNEQAVVTTESNTMFVTINPKTDRELCMFETTVVPDKCKLNHFVSITWSPEKVCLYFDGKIIQEHLIN